MRILVWNAAAKSFVAYKAGTHCPGADVPSGGEWLGEIALAGTRVLWIEGSWGNNEYLTLRTVTPGKKVANVAEAENGSGAGEEPSGDYLGHLYGDGSLLVFNTWSVCMALPPGFVYEAGQICQGVRTAGDEPEEYVYGSGSGTRSPGRSPRSRPAETRSPPSPPTPAGLRSSRRVGR